VNNCSAISSWEQVTFWWDDNDIYVVLYQDAQLDIYCSTQTHILLTRLQANQSLLLLLNTTCLAEKQYIPMIYCTLGEHTNHYTTDEVEIVKDMTKSEQWIIHNRHKTDLRWCHKILDECQKYTWKLETYTRWRTSFYTHVTIYTSTKQTILPQISFLSFVVCLVNLNINQNI
jgi:hypothetical protein